MRIDPFPTQNQATLRPHSTGRAVAIKPEVRPEAAASLTSEEQQTLQNLFPRTTTPQSAYRNQAFGDQEQRVRLGQYIDVRA